MYTLLLRVLLCAVNRKIFASFLVGISESVLVCEVAFFLQLKILIVFKLLLQISKKGIGMAVMHFMLSSFRDFHVVANFAELRPDRRNHFTLYNTYCFGSIVGLRVKGNPFHLLTMQCTFLSYVCCKVDETWFYSCMALDLYCSCLGVLFIVVPSLQMHWTCRVCAIAAKQSSVLILRYTMNWCPTLRSCRGCERQARPRLLKSAG